MSRCVNYCILMYDSAIAFNTAARAVYVRCKNKSDIPLTRIGQPMTLAEVEKQAADLAKFLQVPIEGL